MNVGDLVELSSKGSKSRQNEMCWGLWGMIMKVHKSRNHPYSIEWFKPNGSIHRCPMARYEIKKLRGKK